MNKIRVYQTLIIIFIFLAVSLSCLVICLFSDKILNEDYIIYNAVEFLCVLHLYMQQGHFSISSVIHRGAVDTHINHLNLMMKNLFNVLHTVSN